MKNTTKYTIPSVLAGIVVIALIFALAPVMEASTVHTTIQASTTKIVSSTSASTAADDKDITIECPGGSDGCQILEVFVFATGGQVDINDIDANINSIVATDLIDVNPNDNFAVGTVGNLTELGGFAMAAGDSVTLDVNVSSAAGNRLTVTVIGIIEGDQTDFTFTIEV